MSEEDPSITRPVTVWNDERPPETVATPSNNVEPIETADSGAPETQSTHERSDSKELIERAQAIGRVVLSKTGVVVSRVQEHIVKGAAKARVAYSKVRENLAEKSVERAIDSHYDAISSEIRIGEIRDAAIRTIDKSAPIPERLGSGTELADGDFRARIKDLRMERKIDDHTDAAIKNERLRNNTGTVRSPIRTRARKLKNGLKIGKDFIAGESSASESLTRQATNRGSSVYVETSKVKRAGRAESSEKKKILKYGAKIEKRAAKRTIRAKGKIERKERELEKRKANVTRSRQKLRDLES